MGSKKKNSEKATEELRKRGSNQNHPPPSLRTTLLRSPRLLFIRVHKRALYIVGRKCLAVPRGRPPVRSQLSVSVRTVNRFRSTAGRGERSKMASLRLLRGRKSGFIDCRAVDPSVVRRLRIVAGLRSKTLRCRSLSYENDGTLCEVSHRPFSVENVALLVVFSRD